VPTTALRIAASNLFRALSGKPNLFDELLKEGLVAVDDETFDDINFAWGPLLPLEEGLFCRNIPSLELKLYRFILERELLLPSLTFTARLEFLRSFNQHLLRPKRAQPLFEERIGEALQRAQESIGMTRVLATGSIELPFLLVKAGDTP